MALNNKRTAYTCAFCGKEILRLPSQHKSKQAFCNHDCYSKSMIGYKPSNTGKATIYTKPCLMCGKEISGQKQEIFRRRFCSSACMGKYYSGENCPRFKGGSSWRQQEFNSNNYKEWRIKTLKRDNGKCRWCDVEGKKTFTNLEIHHIIPVSIEKEGMYFIENAITLCKKHHNLTRGRENEYALFLSSIINQKLITTPTANRLDKTPLLISEKQLKELYFDNKMSTIEIGKLLMFSPSCIEKAMKRYSIPFRSARDSRLNYCNKNLSKVKEPQIEKHILNQLYNSENLSLNEIGKKFNLNATTILKYMNFYGMNRRNFSNANTIAWNKRKEMVV